MHCAHCGTPTDELPCTSCGQEPRVVGRYRLEHMLGQGAHGTTWRAVDDQTGEARAVKELPLRLGTPEKVVTLFRREASVLRQLDHPGVPVCHDAIEVGAGRQRTIWIVLDLVDGPSLHREMEGHRYDEGEVLGIMGELLEILDYLHNLSPPVVHRDIKPANVLRGPDGSLVLVDFGSVRDALRQSDLGGSTVAGTFGYMAPEQFAGDAEPATDLYGLGALAVHLLTREAPHNLQDRAGDLDFRSHLRVSDGLATLLDRLLAREPGDRPRSAASALELVRRIQAGEDLPDHGGDGETTDPTPAPVTGPADLAAAPRSRGSAEAPLAQPLTPSPPAGPFRLAVTASARRRLTVQDHAAAVALIEHDLDVSGRASNIGETLRWSASATQYGRRPVQVTLEPHLDGTRIVLAEDMRGLLGRAIAGVAFLGGGLGGMLSLLFFLLGPVHGIAFISSMLALSFLLATAGVRSQVGRLRAQGRQLVGALSAQLGGAAAPLPPPSPGPDAKTPLTMAGVVAAMATVALLAAWLIPGSAMFVAFALAAVLVASVVTPFVTPRARTLPDPSAEPPPQIAQLPDLGEDVPDPERDARALPREAAREPERGG